MTSNAQQLRLELAPDEAERDSYWYRPAEDGETCLICERTLTPGEIVDVLFPVTCLDCMAQLEKEYEDKFGGNHE